MVANWEANVKLISEGIKKAKLKERVINEMLIEPEHRDMWELVKEIWGEYKGRFKDGVTLETIYHRLVELKAILDDD